MTVAAGPHLERIGRWVADQRPETIPDDVARAARLQLLDMVAAAHAGARSGETASIRRGVPAFAGAGPASVLPTGQRLDPCAAALANAACSMAQDFDDIVWMGHPCHSAVFAALAVAETEDADPADLIAAITCANEVGGRIGASALFGPLNGQMWTFVHLVSAAAATARLLHLDAEQTTHALAIALAQPNFALQPAFMEPSSKLLSAATPTVTGIQAAYLARAGMTGAPDILEDRRGFWRHFTYLPLPMMLGDLGTRWVLRTLQIKTVPGCHYFQSACTAAWRILERTGPLAAGDVDHVRVDTTKLGCEATAFAGEYAEPGAITPINVNFDLATTVAIALHAGQLGPEQTERAWLGDNAPAIRRWRERILVRHDPQLTLRSLASTRSVGAGRAALRSVRLRDLFALSRRYRADYGSRLFTPGELAGWLRALRRLPAGSPATPDALAFPNRVTITRAGGRTETERVDVPVGFVGAPGVEAELERKFVGALLQAFGEPAAREAFSRGLHLGDRPLGDFVRRVSAGEPPAQPSESGTVEL